MSIKHGLLKNGKPHKLYSVWRGMKKRCYEPKHDNYKRYGGRGIKVCDEWVNNPAAFVHWALKSGWKPELTIDRIDSDSDYKPNNCRWVTLKENIRNKKRPILGINKQTLLPKGVKQSGNKYVAKISLYKKSIHLGTFDTIEEASAAFINASQEINNGQKITIKPMEKESRLPIGVSRLRDKYRCAYQKKYLGCYDTPEEAREVYLKAKEKAESCVSTT